MAGKPDGNVNSEDLVLDGMILLKWIFNNLDGKESTRLIWLRIGTGGGLV